MRCSHAEILLYKRRYVKLNVYFGRSTILSPELLEYPTPVIAAPEPQSHEISIYPKGIAGRARNDEVFLVFSEQPVISNPVNAEIDNRGSVIESS